MAKVGAELVAGEQVGPYVVEALAGSGGMADVYRVRHTDLGATRALKVDRSGAPDRSTRAITEARLLAAIRHPNLAAVHDVIDVGGRVGVVMDWVEGTTLGAWLATGPSLAQREAVFRQVCAAVAVAHRSGVVHRDLKPANVMVADGPHARVMDFGIARAPGGSGTRAGSVWGTLRYAAPEQIRNAAGVDPRADVWSLGVLWYQMLTGETPNAEDDDPVAAWTLAIRGDWPRPSALVPGLSARHEAVCDAALRANAAERPDDADALLAVLDGAPAGAMERATWSDAPATWAPAGASGEPSVPLLLATPVTTSAPTPDPFPALPVLGPPARAALATAPGRSAGVEARAAAVADVGFTALLLGIALVSIAGFLSSRLAVFDGTVHHAFGLTGSPWLEVFRGATAGGGGCSVRLVALSWSWPTLAVGIGALASLRARLQGGGGWCPVHDRILAVLGVAAIGLVLAVAFLSVAIAE